MRTKAFLLFHQKLWVKSSTTIVAAVFSAVFLGIRYAQKPIPYMDGFILSAYALFLCMAYAGFSIARQENRSQEQILLLRLASPFQYHVGKTISLVLYAISFALVYTIYPAFINAVNNGGLFDPPVSTELYGNAFLLLAASSVCGIMTGSLFCPQIIRDKNLAMLATISVVLLAVIRQPVIQAFSGAKWILWPVPFMNIVSVTYSGADVLTWKATLQIVAVLVLYSIIYAVLRGVLSFVFRREE